MNENECFKEDDGKKYSTELWNKEHNSQIKLWYDEDENKIDGKEIEAKEESKHAEYGETIQ